MEQKITFIENDSLSDEVADIVARMQSGENAFEELYEKTKRYVYYIAISGGVSPNDAEDVVQDTFVHFFKKYKEIQNPRAALAWLKRSAFGHSVDAVRKKKDALITETDENRDDLFDTNALVAPMEVPETLLDKKENARIISDILDTLPDAQKKCVIAFYFDECKVKDIAAAFNVPEGTVKTNLYQGRKRIEKELNEFAKKHGVKVLTVAVIPFLSLAFAEKVSACSLSLSFSAVAGAALSASAGEASAAGTAGMPGSASELGFAGSSFKTGAAAVAKTGAAAASKAVAVKIAIAVAAVVIVGGGSVLAYTQVVKPAMDSVASAQVGSSTALQESKPAASSAASQSSRDQSSVLPSSTAGTQAPSSSAEADVVKANVKDGTYLAFARDINKLTLENGVFDIEFTGVENNMSSYRSQLYNPVSGEQKIQIRCSGNKTIYGDMDYIYPDGGSGHLETLEALQQKITVEKKQYSEYGEEAEDWHDTGYFFEIKDGCLTGIYYWSE